MKNKWKIQHAFTLIELLVVISIIGILASIGLVAFNSAQARSRDVGRKSDLKQLSSALELFYSDYEKYPSSITGQLQACAYNPVNGVGFACSWGVSEFTDGKNIYFKTLPKDPISSAHYYYRIVSGSNNQKFQIFTYLENSQDPSIITTLYSCGAHNCNFSITSSNTTPSE